MEKQSSLDMEQTNPTETLTYMVGQLPLQEMSQLEIVYEEPDARLFLMREGDEYSLYADVKGKITHNRLKHFDQVFLAVIAGLIEQGLDHVITWVPLEEGQLNFARYFGFEDLNSLRSVIVESGSRMILREMIYVFPFDRIRDEANI